MDYVAIDGYIRRFLDTLGLSYDWRINQTTLELLPAELKTRSGKYQYLAQVTGTLSIHGSRSAMNQSGASSAWTEGTARSGVGADVSFDPDKAVKTAQAEAFKKAAHQFGVALELWDEDHRANLEVQRRLASGSEAALKREVFRIAKERLDVDKPTAAQVAKLFGKKAGELADVEVLRAILTDEGLL